MECSCDYLPIKKIVTFGNTDLIHDPDFLESFMTGRWIAYDTPSPDTGYGMLRDRI
jgi:hypothetical protein